MQKKFLVLIICLLVAILSFASGCDVISNIGGGVERTVNIYAINDFHGETDKIAQIGKYLKDVKDENTLIISSGDMFQGSMESNSNYGSLLLQCMEQIGFDSITLGNHEFDWGLEKLQQLVSQSNVKFLGANVYHWDQQTQTFGDFADEIAQPYIVKELGNGLKVGVIGIIGSSQITSISSNLVQSIGFKFPSDVVPQVAKQLREEEKCDVVVVSTHDGASSTLYSRYLDMTEHADAVFCAHSHKTEKELENGVPFLQGASYGKYISHVKLTVNAKGEVECDDYKNISVRDSWKKDESIQALVDKSNQSIETLANEQLATTDGTLGSAPELPRLVCKAIADYAQSLGVTIDLALTNQARNSLYGGDVTYTQLYQSLPFDNIVYIAEVSGAEIVAQASYGNFWRVREDAFVNSDTETYTIAVIDYVLFHQDDNRNYDYFPSAFANGKQPTPLLPNDNPYYNYRDITKAYLKKVGTISVKEFVQPNERTDATALFFKVDFAD